MSENEHVAAIRDYATRIRDDVDYPDQVLRQTVIAMRVDHLIRRADAMATQLAEANARAETAERKIELYEWMAYQRRRNPGISDEDIMRLTYVPEWREEAAS